MLICNLKFTNKIKCRINCKRYKNGKKKTDRVKRQKNF